MTLNYPTFSIHAVNSMILPIETWYCLSHYVGTVQLDSLSSIKKEKEEIATSFANISTFKLLHR